MLPLTIEALCLEARNFADIESVHAEPVLFGVTDGKAVGTYLEHKFRAFLTARYTFIAGNSANGIDFPELGVDMKVTSVNQPQSSCPFKYARQKFFGLGYSLIVFVYEKVDNALARTGTLSIKHTILVDKHRTADFQTTPQNRAGSLGWSRDAPRLPDNLQCASMEAPALPNNCRGGFY